MAVVPVGVDARPQLAYQPTIPVIVRRACVEFSDEDIVVLPDRSITFSQLEEESRRLAKQLLFAGVGKGSRVGIHLPTGPEWVVAFVAATRIGAIAMPFSTLYRPHELREALRIGDVSLLISVDTMMGKQHQDFLEAAIPGLAESRPGTLFAAEVPFLRAVWMLGDCERAWATCTSLRNETPTALPEVDEAILEAAEAQVSAADPMVAVFTSGTTAEPKAVIHTHGAAIRKTSRSADGSLNAQYGGRVLALMPFFWVGGLQEVLSAIQSGATVVTLERLDAAAAVELGVRERVTSVMGNATAMRSVLGDIELSEAIPTLRPLPPRPWAAGPSSLGHESVAIGMTETFGPWNSVSGMECRIIDPKTGLPCAEGRVGEFQIRGYALMHGLYKREREDTFTADGFYATGDLGYRENDRFYFAARMKDLIKTKGANVAPAEVEAVLNAAAGVRMSFVYGSPHEIHGEEVIAGVVVEPGRVVDAEELIGYCRTRLSSYKVPRVVVLLGIDEIPYLASSKPDRIAIRAMLETRCAAMPKAKSNLNP